MHPATKQHLKRMRQGQRTDKLHPATRQALQQWGRLGGQIGGRQKSKAKTLAARQNIRRRWAKARAATETPVAGPNNVRPNA
jgi:hypothetical protein